MPAGRPIVIVETDHHLYLFRVAGSFRTQRELQPEKHDLTSVQVVVRGSFVYTGRTVIEVEDHVVNRARALAERTAGADREIDETPKPWIRLPGVLIAIGGAASLLLHLFMVDAAGLALLLEAWESIAAAAGLMGIGLLASIHPYRGILARRGRMAIGFGIIFAIVVVASALLFSTPWASIAPAPVLALNIAAAIVGGGAAVLADPYSPVPPEGSESKLSGLFEELIE